MLCTSLGDACTSWDQALHKLFQIRDLQKAVNTLTPETTLGPLVVPRKLS